MPFRLPVLVLFAAAALVAGCGSDDAPQGPSKATAITEIGNVRDALTQAQRTYDAGDFETAAVEVGDAYLKHFENVEQRLGEVDNPLMLKIETELRSTLRGKVRDGDPKREVHELFDQIEMDLDAAEAKLK